MFIYLQLHTNQISIYKHIVTIVNLSAQYWPGTIQDSGENVPISNIKYDVNEMNIQSTGPCKGVRAPRQ